ncbi:MAG: AAA family ATPase [Candidatus Woesearchaeota archaeon]|nr:AAA family ATPase [Candidatus Woesearchaeota archaeon]
MSLFDEVLAGGDSLIKNEQALDYEFLPKILPFRESEQRYLATCLKPLFNQGSGRNVMIHGPPGIGKTAATKAVLRDLEEASDDIYVVYVNCWQHNTNFKVLYKVAEELNYKFTQNKSTTELMKVITSMCNKAAVVFVFDEVDKLEDFDFLYNLLEEIFYKSIFMITNYKSWLLELDERIKSRLVPELVEFKQYTAQETGEILKQRLDYAFPPGVWEPDALAKVQAKAAEVKDVRAGLFVMKNAAHEAESHASKKVTLAHVTTALERMDEFFTKHKEELEDDVKKILDVIQEHSGKKIGDLHKAYKKQGGKCSYKTFQRKIARLDQNRFISVEKLKGDGGNTTIVNKKITEY